TASRLLNVRVRIFQRSRIGFHSVENYRPGKALFKALFLVRHLNVLLISKDIPPTLTIVTSD
ncbi:MAG: hypothetical protein AB1352_03140, partial [Patescibacteria group bacterium]